jgi:hypothetical protein
MDENPFDDWRPRASFSLRSLLGVHGVAAAVSEFAANAPLLAGLFAVLAAFILLQMGVLAACTWHVPRSVS